MSKNKIKHEHDPKKLGDVGTPPPATPGEDINVRAIVRFGIILFSTATLVSAAVFAFVQAMSRYEAKADPARPPMGGPQRESGDPDNLHVKAVMPDGGVRLQRQPFALYEQELKEEKAILESNAVVDPKAGTVRIRVARAMELVVHRGLPVRAPGEAVPVVTSSPPPAPAAPTATVSRPSPRPRPAAAKKKAAPPRVAPAAPAAPAAPEEGQ